MGFGIRTISGIDSRAFFVPSRPALPSSFTVKTKEIIEREYSASAKHEGTKVTPDLISELTNGSQINDASSNQFLTECIGAAKFLLSGVSKTPTFQDALQSQIKKYIAAYRTFHEVDTDINVPSVSEIVAGTYSALSKASSEHRIFTFTPGQATSRKILIPATEPGKNKFLVSFEDEHKLFILTALLEKFKELGPHGIRLGAALFINGGTELFLQEQGLDPQLAHLISDDVEKFLLDVKYEEQKGFIEPSPLNTEIKKLVPELLGETAVSPAKRRRSSSALKAPRVNEQTSKLPKPVDEEQTTAQVLEQGGDTLLTEAGSTDSNSDRTTVTFPTIFTSFPTGDETAELVIPTVGSIDSGSTDNTVIVPLDIPLTRAAEEIVRDEGTPTGSRRLRVLRNASEAKAVLGLK